MKKINLCFMFILFFPLFVSADTGTGGITLDATRVIFDSNNSSSKIKVNNKSREHWLLRSWISKYGTTDKINDFIITPPLYRIDEDGSIQLKIDRLTANFPADRESVFHINVMAIPAIGKNNNERQSIKFAINNRIKLFYRPHSINNEADVSTNFEKIKVEKSKDGLVVHNLSPYYITMDDVKVNGKKVTSVSDFMVAPFSTLLIPEKNVRKLSYTTINDYGGKTPIRDISF
ncbi:fimbrial biogenesis chaperone [Escherichia coli]|uniref:fimbrial biogenesis chaperone n=1 Tax=Escherichia coli TaxID=562 RepID=UPI000DE85278|nr:molecular chaperone [Escherichia coli]RBQ41318.1 molecular chaperone [Escherichia coli]